MAQRQPHSGSSIRLLRSSEESHFVASCQAGEPAALRSLFERERSYVHGLLYRVVGSNTHMDDLLQDTFLEVFRSLKSFRGESSLRTWIHRCAVRVAYAHFKQKAQVPALEPVPDMDARAPNPEERALRREAARRLYAELDRLEPKQRMAFVLFTLEGRSLREIAELMESTLAAAKVRTWRARRALTARAAKDPLLSEFLSGNLEPGEESER